jgi:hypothetical protein
LQPQKLLTKESQADGGKETDERERQRSGSKTGSGCPSPLTNDTDMIQYGSGTGIITKENGFGSEEMKLVLPGT